MCSVKPNQIVNKPKVYILLCFGLIGVNMTSEQDGSKNYLS